MERKIFEKRYARRIAMCKQDNSIRPITAFIHELAGMVEEEEPEIIKYIQEVEHDLFTKRVIPFKVEGVDDLTKIERLPDGEARQFLLYVWIAYRRKAEDWYWDEKLQQYVCRNSFWSKKIELLTPEEYHKRADEFYVAGNVDDFLEFQRTHSILYADPIPEQDKEILKDMEVPELPDDIEPILM